MRRRFALFYDVQRKAVLQLHARCTENGTHRTRRSTLFPDHFTNVALGNAQSNDSGIALCNRLDGDAARVINQGMSNFGNKFCHVLYRVFPCRKLRRLSHHTHLRIRESRRNAQAHPSSRLKRDLPGCAGTSATPVTEDQGTFCFTKPIFLTLQYQGVYAKLGAAHTGGTYCGSYLWEPFVTFPKLAVTSNFYAATTASAGFAAISFPTRSDNCAPLLVQ